MEALECRVQTKDVRTRFRIYPVGDMHCDSLAFDEKRFNAYIAHIARDPAGVVFVVGDYVEGRVPGRQHFDPKALIPDARLHIGDYVPWALDRSEKLLAPLRAAKVPLFMWQGNHDLYMEYSGFTAELARRLKAQFCGDEALVRITAVGQRPGHKNSEAVIVYGTHGSGGAGLPGAKINTAQRRLTSFDADCYISGHVHDSFIRILDRTGITRRGEPELVEQQAAIVVTPSFVRRAVRRVHTYASRKGYPSADQGLLYLESLPKTRLTDRASRTQMWYREWQRHEFCP